MTRREFVRVSAVGFGLFLMMGCSSEEKPLVVKGSVTHQGQPVTEGLVQFSDPTTGRGAEVELRPDGTYEATLFAGRYEVLVSPPYIVDNSSGIPNPRYKKVKNIPAKYHSTVTSKLEATVAPDNLSHNFDLKP